MTRWPWVSIPLLLLAGSASAGGSFKPLGPETTDAVRTAVENLGKAAKAANSRADYLGTYDPLTEDDADYAEAYGGAGAPQVPSRCAESRKCGHCFEDAYGDLNRQRYRFEKLRRIYKSTMHMNRSALAYGDNASGIHGITGLGWQLRGREPIEQGMKSFHQTSVQKYQEILAEFHVALQKVAQCEEEFYDEEDWYNRFGFIYYQFVADRYRPDDL